jgi:hypothetical protein
MQVVAAAAMEAPARGDPTTRKKAKVALFRSVVEANPAHPLRAGPSRALLSHRAVRNLSTRKELIGRMSVNCTQAEMQDIPSL